MGIYSDQVLPRFIDVALGRQFEGTRARVAAGLSGEVLEIGFGSGRNVPHYPTGVSRVYAIDPATVGRKLAAGRVAASPIPVEYVGLDGASVPLEDASVDHVLVTWTLCTIPDVSGALREVHRVLRPGGELHFIEHGRSPDENVARRQDRITPLWRKLFGGCHVNRAIPDLITEAGLRMTRIEARAEKGPKVASWMYEGVATRE